MTIRWAWFVPVLFVSIKDDKKKWDAYNYLCLILIQKGYANDLSRIEHELVHTKQIIMTLGLHVPLYFFCKSYKYWSELSAYKISIKNGMLVETAASTMAGNYSFSKTEEEILKNLSEQRSADHLNQKKGESS